MRRILILFLFFLTGASGLIYQVAWVRESTLVFGVSIYAYSAVLAAFMGGLALGSYAFAASPIASTRRCDSSRCSNWPLPASALHRPSSSLA